MKEFSLIFKNILHNKAIWILTIFQVALTLAVLVNSYASISGYGNVIADDMGIADKRIVAVNLEFMDDSQASTSQGSLVDDGGQRGYFQDRIDRTVRLISQQPDIESVSYTDGFPLSNDAKTKLVKVKHDDELDVGITVYTADQNFLDTLEVAVVSGRGFESGEVLWRENNDNGESLKPLIIISSALADELFPTENPLDKRISIDGRYYAVIGVAERLPGLHPLWSNTELSAILPGRLAGAQSKLLVRVKADANLSASVSKLGSILSKSSESQAEFYSITPLSELKSATLATASATLKILGFITVLLLIVSALGIYGQTSFNIARKAKETGIKRALGATKFDILSYYLLQNWLVTSFGILLGLILATLLNYVLIQGLGATQINLTFILPSILFLWIVGLMATYFPARRASNISPVQATRAV
ncbi:MAG: putative ABC transport system permease protein [Arenicella sp.]|jgi:putative ABC transport system permease protein